ncbi:MAG: flagellar biosynthesis protein FlhB [Lachnospiraceae bacterium]|nr:flagellar biosynthesis protein FlhB [Lachnospiraceae bacterium]
MTDRYIIRYNLQFFAKDGPGGEKTEEPTAKRKEDTRKKGQVAKSQEVYNAVSLIVMFIILKIYGEGLGEKFLNVFRWIYGSVIVEAVKPAGGNINSHDVHILIIEVLMQFLGMLLPILLVTFVVAFVVNLLQVGWKVSFEPMKPKGDKLNPLSGVKRLFSMQKVIELVKSILKIVLIGAVVYNYLIDRIGFLFLLEDYSINGAVGFTASSVVELGLRIAAVYIVIAAGDYIYNRWKHHEDLKMTKQEIKDEMKDSEGNPEIKSKIRQKMMQASRARMMKAVPEADVVITNPTHYAVALKYDPAVASAPIVLAKGQDYMAQKIKETARENDVEIVENKPLARMLYANVEVDEVVPPELYQAVAEVLAFVYNIKKKEQAS